MEENSVCIEQVRKENVNSLVGLVLDLWPEGSFEEELAFYQGLVSSDRDFCCLAQTDGKYVGFIHGSLRTEYVEGADTSPVAYLEGIYVVPDFQKSELPGGWWKSWKNGREAKM